VERGEAEGAVREGQGGIGGARGSFLPAVLITPFGGSNEHPVLAMTVFTSHLDTLLSDSMANDLFPRWFIITYFSKYKPVPNRSPLVL
jgi:hypothetical protein